MRHDDYDRHLAATLWWVSCLVILVFAGAVTAAVVLMLPLGAP